MGIHFPTTFSLFLKTSDIAVATTATYATTAMVPVERFLDPGYPVRIYPGDPAKSAIPRRMSIRAAPNKCPPSPPKLATAPASPPSRSGSAPCLRTP